MIPTVIKLRSERRGEHVHTTVFMGIQGQTLACCGTLVMRLGEWQDHGAALLLGARATGGRIVVECEGDYEVVGDHAIAELIRLAELLPS